MANLFTIPAAAPFLPTLAEALLEGRLIPGFPGEDPLALADATIYLPTQRAARAFADALIASSDKPGLVLPRIAPLGAFASDEGEDFARAEVFDDRPAVGDLARRMTLAKLIAAWGGALKGAIRRVSADGRLEVDEAEATLIAATPAQALALADDLGALVDDMRVEGVPFARLAELAPDRFDPYWKITLEFLKIAFDAWPKWLAERGLADRAERTEIAVEREIAALKEGRRGPIIVAGSTGTNRAVAQLIGAVASDPRGAVVLPDLDSGDLGAGELDDAAWRMVAEAIDPTAATHPQAALARLARQNSWDRRQVVRLAEPGPRARFVSQAMRPADSTELWVSTAPFAPETFAGLALVEAEQEAEEALAAALALREVLETPGRTAALVTPDPGVARRVAAELVRWGVEAENSAGARLGDSPAGRLARVTLAAARDFSPAPVVALLACPGVRLGRDEAAYARAARALDLSVLRMTLPTGGLDDPEAAMAAAREAAQSPHAHIALKTLDAADFSGAAALLADLIAALAPLRETDDGPVCKFIHAHRAALAALGGAEDDELSAFFDEWEDACSEDVGASLADYASMFEILIAGRAPPSPRGHPRIALLGLLEARLLDFDRLVLAGFDETVWPPAARTDPFLNRTMRGDLGLSPPERRLGQTAHDFTQALQKPDVILTRSRKRNGAPTVPSRLLLRVEALAGVEAIAELRARGRHWLELARWLDHGEMATPATRPCPKPDVELRPTRLSVTRIETLRRDPYAIYAEYVLRLKPLPPIAPEVGPIEQGTAWHATVEAFASDPAGSHAERRARLHALAETHFAPLLADESFRALRWPRIRDGLDFFLEFDGRRRENADRIWLEESGALDFVLDDGSQFRLSGRADRIELGRDGAGTVIDFKSGAPPGKGEVEVGFSPQLTLEAAMLKRGAFKTIGPLDIQAGLYVKLGGKDGGKETRLELSPSFAVKAEEHFAELHKVLNQLRNPATGFLSKPHPKFLAKGTDYDHLARVAEWSLAEGDDA